MKVKNAHTKKVLESAPIWFVKKIVNTCTGFSILTKV